HLRPLHRPKVPHEYVRMGVEPNRCKSRPRGNALAAPSDSPAAAGVPITSKAEVFEHRQPVDETELLVDEPEPCCAGRIGIAWGEANSRRPEWVPLPDPACDSREDLRQRRLAGSVVPDEVVHLAWADIELHPGECTLPDERLRDVPDQEHRLSRARHSRGCDGCLSIPCPRAAGTPA